MATDGSPYLALKIAQAVFNKTLGDLTPAERQRVDTIVACQVDIERRILATPMIVLPAESIDAACNEIRARYASDAAFTAALGDAWPTGPARGRSERSLRVDAVLECRVGGVVEVSETDVELFYLIHHYVRAERCGVRHILITINDAFKGNRRANACWRIEMSCGTRRRRPSASPNWRHAIPNADGAQRRSDRHGAARHVHPELDRVAFALDVGQVSPVVESENGFHLVQCVSAQPAATLSLAEVAARIRESRSPSRSGKARETVDRDADRQGGLARRTASPVFGRSGELAIVRRHSRRQEPGLPGESRSRGCYSALAAVMRCVRFWIAGSNQRVLRPDTSLRSR